jgi:hypothetical protein
MKEPDIRVEVKIDVAKVILAISPLVVVLWRVL